VTFHEPNHSCHGLAAALIGLFIGVSVGSLIGGLLGINGFSGIAILQVAKDADFGSARILVALGAFIGLFLGALLGPAIAWLCDRQTGFPLWRMGHFHSPTNR